MQLHDLDARLLSRAGQVLQALTRWFALNPTDQHPTVDQLAAVPLDGGVALHRRTVQRGLKELTGWGVVINRPDPAHPVTRSLGLTGPSPSPATSTATATATGGVGDRSATPDQYGAPNLSPLLRSKDDAHENVERSRDNPVTEQKISQEARDRAPLGDPLAKLLVRLTAQVGAQVAQANAEPRIADLGHLEQQRRLPLSGPGSAGAGPQARSGLRLVVAIHALENGRPESVDPAVERLSDQFGPGYEPLYRKLCSAVQLGAAPLAGLVAAIEEATRTNAKHQGRSFTAAAKRNFPKLYGRGEGKPAVAPPLPDPATAGRSAEAGTFQSTATAV